MSRVGRQPIAVPEKVKVDIDGSARNRARPQGGAVPRRLAGDEPSIWREGNCSCQPPQRRPAPSRPARPHPQPARQHGHRRRQRLHQDAGAPRRRLSRRRCRGTSSCSASATRTRSRCRRRRASPWRWRGPTACSCRGIDKELVGQVAADVRAVRPPEPYKGKGIRYAGEKVRRKAGKAGRPQRALADK